MRFKRGDTTATGDLCTVDVTFYARPRRGIDPRDVIFHMLCKDGMTGCGVPGDEERRHAVSAVNPSRVCKRLGCRLRYIEALAKTASSP